jgi:cyclohexanone monooxygenase
MQTKESLRIAVIGAGPSGIATGHELLEKGFTNFRIFEKAPAAGGTWHLHTYPGLACDVWAHSYTFSYRPNPDWTSSFADQPEIEAYLQNCVREFGLEPYLELNTRIVRAVFDEDAATWALTSEKDESWTFDIVINAMGNQHTALYPEVPGRDSFAGDTWHATEWNHDVDLKGKKVVIVGSAASAVQIVPEVAKLASHLTVLQRTPNWIMPRGSKPYSESRRAWNRRLPFLIRATQKMQGIMMGFVHKAATNGNPMMENFEKRAKKFIDETIPDPELREALTPTSSYACKRGLVSDGFYPTLMEDHVELIPAGLASVTPTGITTANGRTVDADVLIYCTGYRILDFDRIEVLGKEGKSLADVMAVAPESHKGIAAPGFPNYFFAVGPNGLVLNVPYFTTVERNVASIVKLLGAKQEKNLPSLEVKQEAHDEYNDWMRSQFGLYSWGSSNCNSYYQNAAGQAPFLFPGDFKTYDEFHESLGLEDFHS